MSPFQPARRRNAAAGGLKGSTKKNLRTVNPA